MQSDSMAKTADYVSLSSLGYEPFVCAHALFAPSVLRSARAPDDWRRPLACMGRLIASFVFSEIGPVAQLVRAHA